MVAQKHSLPKANLQMNFSRVCISLANVFNDIPVHVAYTIFSSTVATHYDMLQILIVLCMTCMVQGVDTVLNQHFNLFLDVGWRIVPHVIDDSHYNHCA